MPRTGIRPRSSAPPRAHQQRGRPAGRPGGAEGPQGRPPRRVVESHRGEVEHQQRGVEGPVQHRREAVAERLLVAPDEGVVVERVRDRHELGERPGDPSGLLLREVREIEVETRGLVGDDRRLTTRATQAHHAVPGQRPERGQDMERVEQSGDRVDAVHAEASEQRRVGDVAPDHRPGVGGGDPRTGVRSSRLERHHGHRTLGGDGAGRREAPDVVERLDVEADAGHRRVRDQCLEAVLDADAGLVAERQQVGDRHGSGLHREVQADVAALGDKGDPPVGAAEALLVGPQGRPGDRRDRAVAVGSDHRHVPGGSHQFRLQAGALGPHLGEARGVADRRTRIPGRQAANHVDRGLPVDCHERRIRRPRQVVDAPVRGQAAHLVPRRVDRPEVALEAEGQALFDGGPGGRTAHEGQRPGSQQTGERADDHVGNAGSRSVRPRGGGAAGG